MAGTETWKPPLKQGERDLDRVREALRRWLSERLSVGPPLELSPIVRPKASGVSNETLIFDAAWRGGRRRLVARLQTDDPLYLEASVERQYRVYEALGEVAGVRVPTLVGLERDPAVLGTPFYVMDHVDGLVPSDNPHFIREGWVVAASEDQREAMWRSAVAQLVALHRVDPACVPFLDRPDRGPTGLEQDLAYWRTYHRWAAGGERHPVMEAAEAWLLDRVPAQPATAFSWGDARVENMVFADFDCAAVLDFESASLAGPTADLAWWALMDRGSDRLPGLGTPQQTIELHRTLGGPDLGDLRYHLVLCAFRLAGIYLRIAAQLERRGQLTPATRDLGRASEKMQQLALLLEVPAPCPVTATLPDLDL